MFVLTHKEGACVSQEGKPSKEMNSAEFSAFLSAFQLVESAAECHGKKSRFKNLIRMINFPKRKNNALPGAG